MKKLSLTALALTNLLCLTTACGDSSGDDTDGSTTASTPATPATEPEPTTGTQPTDTTAETGNTTGAPADGPVCAHLGGIDGVGELVGNFLGKVLANDKINAYFLTSDTEFDTLPTCVINQLGEATGCDGVTYGCRTMKASHEGLGISQQDFDDFAADFIAAWDEHKATHPDVTDEDFTTVIGVLGGLAPEIVEDTANNATVYQRVGRKPAIKGLIGEPGAAGSFVDNVANDASINGFFGATDFVRLNTCLTRQVHSLDGPNTYGKEIDPIGATDPGVSAAAPCADMVSSHANLVDANDGLGIEVADFSALVGDLVTAMTDAGVTTDDQNIIAGILGPLCSSIVTVDPENCP